MHYHLSSTFTTNADNSCSTLFSPYLPILPLDVYGVQQHISALTLPRLQSSTSSFAPPHAPTNPPPHFHFYLDTYPSDSTTRFSRFASRGEQEGFSALWRGTNASLALAVPTVGIYLPCYDIFRNHLEEFTARNAPGLTPYAPLVAGALARSLACTSCYPIELARTRMQAFKHLNGDKIPPGVVKTLIDAISHVKSTTSFNNSFQNCRVLWTGLGAQLARDVPFSAICWSALELARRQLLGVIGGEANVVSVLGANFSAGFVAGSLAAAATCPLDVAKTRRAD